MPVRWLNPSRILSIEHYTDFDAFRPSEVLGGGTSTPLQLHDFSFSRAVLPLQDGLFVLQRSFARHLEANLGTDQGVGVIVPLAYHAIVNGREADNSMVGIVRGKVPVRAIEQHPNTYLLLRFNSDMRHRGWMDYDAGFERFELRSDVMRPLRAAILDLFCLASSCNDPREFEILQRPMRETMLACLDAALVPDEARRARSRSFDRHAKLVGQLDEQAELLGSAPLYSDELAQALGVSVRTLQTATKAVHGVSLHQYLRLKRLWAARKLLVSGNAGLTVKAAALANGFCHMGEFSRGYKSVFGEMPSETLAQGRCF